MKNLLNKRFGKLRVVEHIGKLGMGKKFRHRWKCQCDCGGTVVTQSNHLLSGDTRSCGCLNLRNGNNSPLFRGYGEIPLNAYKHIKDTCNRYGRNIPFDISIQYLWKLFLRQNRRCAITGVILDWSGSWAENRYSKTSKRTASLDRIDSSKGYVKGNVQWVHKIINVMKNDMTAEEFHEWCQKVVVHNISS